LFFVKGQEGNFSSASSFYQIRGEFFLRWLVYYGYKVGFNSRCHREEGLVNLLRSFENGVKEIKKFGYALLRWGRSQITNYYESNCCHNQTGEDW